MPDRPSPALPGASPSALCTPPAPTSFERYLELHADTDGWFSRESAAVWDALLSAQRAQGVAGHLLEIGVWHGKSAALLVQHARPEREDCLLVDLYLDQPRVEATLRRTGADLDCVRLLRCDSRRLHVDPLVAEGYRAFRFVHVDGEHTAEAVASDLALAAALLSVDGLVVVDDFFNWMYPQVTQAVFRHLREQPDQFALLLAGFNKAYLVRPHRLHSWLAFCRADLPAALEERGVSATLAKTTYPGELDAFGIGPRQPSGAFRGPDWDQQAIL